LLTVFAVFGNRSWRQTSAGTELLRVNCAFAPHLAFGSPKRQAQDAWSDAPPYAALHLDVYVLAIPLLERLSEPLDRMTLSRILIGTFSSDIHRLNDTGCTAARQGSGRTQNPNVAEAVGYYQEDHLS
jgi:hypothetical protein